MLVYSLAQSLSLAQVKTMLWCVTVAFFHTSCFVIFQGSITVQSSWMLGFISTVSQISMAKLQVDLLDPIQKMTKLQVRSMKGGCTNKKFQFHFCCHRFCYQQWSKNIVKHPICFQVRTSAMLTIVLAYKNTSSLHNPLHIVEDGLMNYCLWIYETVQKIWLHIY